MKLLGQNDVDKNLFASMTVAVVGYGSQGRAQALNLRDSGVKVLLGLREGGASWALAKRDGWTPMPIAKAVAAADLTAVLVPDMCQGALFADEIAPNLSDGAAVLFAHGFAVHYGQVTAPDNVDVVLIAPKSPGGLVRRQYVEGYGVPCLYAVHKDAGGDAAARALAYAHGIGGTRAGVLQTTFAEETETDLFGEQAVLCGGVTELVTAGFDTLVSAGYQPEIAYFECLHELKLIVDLLHEGGLERLHKDVSETARWGDMTCGPVVVDRGTRTRMATVLSQIQDGTFAKRWIDEDRAGRPNYNRLMEADLAHPIERVGKKLRARMPWLSGGGSK